MKIRPHHGLCAEFFRGEGYSGEFTKNMISVLSELNENNPEILLTVGTDEICRCCIHNVENHCKTAEKTARYDRAVLDICGFSDGETLLWEDFRSSAREKIICENRLAEICGDCSWYEICGKIGAGEKSCLQDGR